MCIMSSAGGGAKDGGGNSMYAKEIPPERFLIYAEGIPSERCTPQVIPLERFFDPVVKADDSRYSPFPPPSCFAALHSPPPPAEDTSPFIATDQIFNLHKKEQSSVKK